MRDWTPEQQEAYRQHVIRADERAVAALRPGDRIRVTRCGGASPTYTFVGWDGRWACSKSGRDDLSPFCVIAVNGKPTSFRDDPEAHLADPFGPPSVPKVG